MSKGSKQRPGTGFSEGFDRIWGAREAEEDFSGEDDLAAWCMQEAQTDAEFDAEHGGRDLLPIEQIVYEAEGAARFAKHHLHGKTFPAQAEYADDALSAEGD